MKLSEAIDKLDDELDDDEIEDSEYEDEDEKKKDSKKKKNKKNDKSLESQLKDAVKDKDWSKVSKLANKLKENDDKENDDKENDDKEDKFVDDSGDFEDQSDKPKKPFEM